MYQNKLIGRKSLSYQNGQSRACSPLLVEQVILYAVIKTYSFLLKHSIDKEKK